MFTGDSLLVGDVGRPDLHADGDPEPLARELYGSMQRLLRLDDGVLVYPSHYRRLRLRPWALGQPVLVDRLRAAAQPGAAARRRSDAFVQALLVDVPPPPADQAAIVAANRSGRAHQPA